MSDNQITGRVHSLQSLGTVDGPGIRFVVFMQGCNLRCKCCHNPDTWAVDGGTEYTASQLVQKAERYREYFGPDGGITVSGGEPLLQAEFVHELFSLCKDKDINTCLDTSGSILSDKVEKLLSVTDRVLLDIKYTDDLLYRENAGCGMDVVLKFLSHLNSLKIPTTLRQVIIPGLNDNDGNINAINKIVRANPCVDKVELLPFKKICQVKYDNMGIEFPFSHIPEPDPEVINNLKEKLCF